MPTYTLDELQKKMEPQAQRDKALIRRCVDGLSLYAAGIAENNRHSSKIEEMRKLAVNLVGYWGLDDYGANAKASEEILDAFDEKVWEARSGGSVTGDIFQTAPNVIYGLYRYGEEMIVGQGRDVMGEILDMRDLMNDIAQTWDFEPDVLDGLTARLEAGVRELLDSKPLPGQPVSGLSNVGYVINQVLMFDNDRGFALGHNPNAPAPFVTWQFNHNENGSLDYYWGSYHSSEDRAQIGYITRSEDYRRQYKVNEKPFPFAAVEMGAEQNCNMIDGVPNNTGIPKPDLTDGQTYTEIRELAPETLPENNTQAGSSEKTSVLDQIRAAQKAPKQPREQKPERDKKKTDPEL